MEAFDLAKKGKSIGWSYGNAGLVFGSIMSVMVNHSDKAGTINDLLEGYANRRSIYSMRFSIEGNSKPAITFYKEIVKGLKQTRSSKSEITRYLSWAEKIGESRINHIVSNKHRGAYARAA